MARARTLRQRLKRDPANQRRSKLIAWARKHSDRVRAVAFPLIVDPRPRILWREGKEPVKRSGPDRVRWHDFGRPTPKPGEKR